MTYVNKLIKGIKPSTCLKFSIAAAIATMLLKILAWRLTNSVGYLSDAMESFINLASAIFALIMITISRMPADEDHNFGHGKAEYFSAGFEGILIFGAGIAIIFPAADRLLAPAEISNLGVGTIFLLLSGIINYAVARLLLFASKQHASLALAADAKHLLTDVWTTIGVIIGVTLVKLTEILWLDPVIAIIVALNIIWVGFKLIREAFDGLMDKVLPESELKALNKILAQFSGDSCEIYNIRTRMAGPQRFAHVNIRVPGAMTVLQAHELADNIENAVLLETRIVLTSRIEPYEKQN